MTLVHAIGMPGYGATFARRFHHNAIPNSETQANEKGATMSQGNQEGNSEGQTIPAVQTVSGANKKRSWLRIVVVVVLVMGIIAAFRMWYDSQQLKQLNRRMPGLPESPRNNAVNEPIRKGPQRVIHPETQCSIVLPAEWKQWERPGKSLAYIGPVRKDSTPNILMNVVPLTGKVKDYASAELESMKKVWSNLEMLEEGPCQTQSGLQGYKVVFKRKVPDGSRTLLNRYYFFTLQQDRCLIFLATSSDVFGNELDALFEECAHSIESK